MSNPNFILLLSGSVAVGKTTVTRHLIEHSQFRVIKTGAHLASIAKNTGLGIDRRSLQELGDKLDLETDFEWVVDIASQQINAQPGRWLLDSVRKPKQIEHFRERFVDGVLHIHLTASEELLRARYNDRLANGGEYPGQTTYEEAIAHSNEIITRQLEPLSDFTIDAGSMDPASIAAVILEKFSGR